MSQLKVNSIVDAAGGSSAVLYGVASPPNSMGFRNRIINGDCRIDQRNAGASVTPANAGYTLDRWVFSLAQASKLTCQQNAGAVTPPAGFANYLGITSSSAYTVGSGENFNLVQRIEGFNTADLAWGTANAQAVTLSFWVRSSLTGTFGGVIQNSAGNRSYPFTYTINASNTWELETIVISGDTVGTWLTTNGVGIAVWFGLGVSSTLSGTAGTWSGSALYSATGATSVVGTSGATFYITGVQLEAGSVATPFERRDYGRELMMCQRYCVNYRSADATGPYYRYAYGDCVNSVAFAANIALPVQMRATPSLTAGGVAASYGVYTRQYIVNCSTLPYLGVDGTGVLSVNVNAPVASGLTQGSVGSLLSQNNQTSYLLFSSEL